MLFRVKRRLAPTLLLADLLVVITLHFGFRGPLEPPTFAAVFGGLVVIFGSDAIIHGLLCQYVGERYRRAWRDLAWYFEAQGPAEMVAGGVLAMAEEMFFRGVLLRGLTAYGLPPVLAAVVSGVLFAGLHDLERRELRLFTVWAIWEGTLLGLLYLATGSLPAVMLVHGLHDTLGFGLFAYERNQRLA